MLILKANFPSPFTWSNLYFIHELPTVDLLVNSQALLTMPCGTGLITMAPTSYTLLVKGLPGMGIPSYRTSIMWGPENGIHTKYLVKITDTCIINLYMHLSIFWLTTYIQLIQMYRVHISTPRQLCWVQLLTLHLCICPFICEQNISENILPINFVFGVSQEQSNYILRKFVPG